MKYYSIGEFSKLIGKNSQTLREWDKKDILKIRNEFYKDINFGLKRKRVKFMGIPS